MVNLDDLGRVKCFPMGKRKVLPPPFEIEPDPEGLILGAQGFNMVRLSPSILILNATMWTKAEGGIL